MYEANAAHLTCMPSKRERSAKRRRSPPPMHVEYTGSLSPVLVGAASRRRATSSSRREGWSGSCCRAAPAIDLLILSAILLDACMEQIGVFKPDQPCCTRKRHLARPIITEVFRRLHQAREPSSTRTALSSRRYLHAMLRRLWWPYTGFGGEQASHEYIYDGRRVEAGDTAAPLRRALGKIQNKAGHSNICFDVARKAAPQRAPHEVILLLLDRCSSWPGCCRLPEMINMKRRGKARRQVEDCSRRRTPEGSHPASTPAPRRS